MKSSTKVQAEGLFHGLKGMVKDIAGKRSITTGTRKGMLPSE